MSKKQIVLAGVGGQGVISAGSMLAEAAAIFENKEALMGCAYGSEARGTFTKSEVIIDDKRIFFPEVQQADIVIALHQIAYDRYVGSLGPETKLMYDSDCITPSESKAVQIAIPLSAVAQECGAVSSQNMVALGILSSMDDMLKPEPLEMLIERKFSAKPKVVARNIKALNAGRDYAAKNL